MAPLFTWSKFGIQKFTKRSGSHGNRNRFNLIPKVKTSQGKNLRQVAKRLHWGFCCFFRQRAKLINFTSVASKIYHPPAKGCCKENVQPKTKDVFSCKSKQFQRVNDNKKLRSSSCCDQLHCLSRKSRSLQGVYKEFG